MFLSSNVSFALNKALNDESFSSVRALTLKPGRFIAFHRAERLGTTVSQLGELSTTRGTRRRGGSAPPSRHGPREREPTAQTAPLLCVRFFILT